MANHTHHDGGKEIKEERNKHDSCMFDTDPLKRDFTGGNGIHPGVRNEPKHAAKGKDTKNNTGKRSPAFNDGGNSKNEEENSGRDRPQGVEIKNVKLCIPKVHRIPEVEKLKAAYYKANGR